jgi:hypothetical protein
MDLCESCLCMFGQESGSNRITLDLVSGLPQKKLAYM